MIKYFLYVGSVIVIAANTALAQAPATPAASSTIAIPNETATDGEQKVFGLSLSMIGKSSFHRPDDVSKSGSTELWMNPSMKLTKDYRLGALAIYARNFESREEPNTISNTKIVLSRSAIELRKNLKLIPSAAVRAPTNREARQDDRLITGFGIEPKLVLETSRLTTTYRLALTKNIHEETLDRNGSANISWSQSHLLDLTYKLSDRVSAGVSGEYISSRTYRDYGRSRFDLSEAINIDAGQGFSFDIGHSNSGDALKPNLSDSNIAFYDDEGSIVYVGVNYVY